MKYLEMKRRDALDEHRDVYTSDCYVFEDIHYHSK